jgi:hypothetical protein
MREKGRAYVEYRSRPSVGSSEVTTKTLDKADRP